MKKKFFLILYYLFAKNLPNYSYPGGKLFNKIRILCMKNILKIGTNCRIMKNVYFGNGNNVEIGDNCRINENVRLDNVKIGNGVLIARDTIFLGKMHEYADIDSFVIEQGNKKVDATIVENDVWFGLRTIVFPGLKIAKSSIIGAGAVVTKNTDQYGIYIGIPAKLLKYRSKST